MVKEAQHSNIDGSCGQVDRDACGYPLALPITGRRVYGNSYEWRESCRAPGVKFCSSDSSSSGWMGMRWRPVLRGAGAADDVGPGLRALRFVGSGLTGLIV